MGLHPLGRTGVQVSKLCLGKLNPADTSYGEHPPARPTPAPGRWRQGLAPSPGGQHLKTEGMVVRSRAIGAARA